MTIALMWPKCQSTLLKILESFGRDVSTGVTMCAMASNNMSNAPMPSTLRQGPPSAPLGAAPAPARLQQLQQILTRFEVSIAEANDLVILEDYEVVCILDDSGSMNLASQPATQRSLFAESKTRWQELQESVTLLVELANCFDKTGVDLFFLNRGLIDGVKTPKDERLAAAFRRSAAGGTPLTQSLRIVAEHCEGERPILLMIFTDGEPNGGVRQFEKELKRLVTKKSSDKTFKVQIMACTSDQDAVGYLNEIDEKFGKVDVTDDYYSEMQEVVMKARKRPQFTRGDWLMKAMLGPISQKFDGWDETGKARKCTTHCDDSDCSDHDEQCELCSIC